MRSLRARLLYRTAAAVVATMVAAAVLLYVSMRASLLAEFDAALLLEARSLAAHVEQAGDRLQIEQEIAELPEYSSAAHPHFYEMHTGESSTAVRSTSLTDSHLALPAQAPVVPVHQPVALPGGAAGRQVVIGFEPRLDDEDQHAERDSTPPRAILAVARETTALEAALSQLGGLLLVVTIAAAAVCVVLSGGVIRRELKPLDGLADSIAQIGAENLAKPIGIAECPSELAPVVDCLNRLLGRLDEALTREKSFTADVAHELRTPLAGLETTLEVCASRPRGVADYHTALANCLAITRGLHVLVDNLLLLARADADQRILDRVSVEIIPLVRDCWSPFAARAAERGVSIEWFLDGAPRAMVDRESARQVFTNLFDNAVTYADSGSRILTSIAGQGSQAVVVIANSGCTLSPGDAARVFDRFWRGDASRTGAGRHCGLGLSLCKKLVDLHAGTVLAEIRDGWFFVTVKL